MSAEQGTGLGQEDFGQGPEDDVIVPSYPAYGEDEILPSIPGDPLPNPEPEQPSLGVPDPGIYEGSGGTASLE